MYYCKFKLISDIEKNSGPTPMYVDSSKTIVAPYSQGQRCVAFFDLQYQTKQFCSRSHQHSEILKSIVFKFVSISKTVLFNADRIANYVNVFQDDYQLEYCESYSDTVHRENNRRMSVLYLFTKRL